MACVLVLAALQLVPAPHALHIAPTRRGVTTQRASHRDVSMATRGNARADDATRRRLFQALAHNRQPAGAITDLQPLRNEHEFAQCIDAWGRSREWKRALETLADYSCWAEAEAGMAVATIDIVPYNVALKACATSARWREAVDTLASMRAREGLHPDVLSYNTAISACSRHGDGHWADASSLLEQMREDGLQPSTRTYNSCLASCARGGLYLEAQALLDELTPSPALGRGGGGRGKGRDEGPTEEAERERQQARQKAGLAVADEANFNAAITACARGGAWAEATALLDRMAAHGVAPTASSYLQAMQALTSASPPRLAEGFALLQRLEEAGLATQKKSYGRTAGPPPARRRRHRRSAAHAQATRTQHARGTHVPTRATLPRHNPRAHSDVPEPDGGMPRRGRARTRRASPRIDGAARPHRGGADRDCAADRPGARRADEPARVRAHVAGALRHPVRTSQPADPAHLVQASVPRPPLRLH